ncbi:MAG: hypothetical protein R2708_29130 [Vicinamibacterales bacterium]
MRSTCSGSTSPPGRVRPASAALEFGSSSVGQRTVVYYVRLASGGVNPGWTIDGENVTSANTARIRICNNTGGAADPPNLVFSLMTVSVP